MIVSLRHFLGWLVSSFSCRADLVLENLALRRQLLALHAQRPRRRLTALHKLFWVVSLANCYFAHNSSVFPVRYDSAMRNLVILFTPVIWMTFRRFVGSPFSGPPGA